MSVTGPNRLTPPRLTPSRLNPSRRRPGHQQLEGLGVLVGIVGVMWIVEVINTLDGNGLDGDGLYARNLGRIWGILTSPFIHASFQHLFDNTVPLVFLGVIIALRGAARLSFITAFVILVGGFGTWLISPAGVTTIGASGVVLGYAGYLLARGFFDRRLGEVVVGVVVALVWGAALFSSLVPQQGVSWQAHVCGGIAGVLAAWIMSSHDARRRSRPRPGTVPRPVV